LFSFNHVVRPEVSPSQAHPLQANATIFTGYLVRNTNLACRTYAQWGWLWKFVAVG
jgi:hypothetical protein